MPPGPVPGLVLPLRRESAVLLGEFLLLPMLNMLAREGAHMGDTVRG